MTASAVPVFTGSLRLPSSSYRHPWCCKKRFQRAHPTTKWFLDREKILTMLECAVY